MDCQRTILSDMAMSEYPEEAFITSKYDWLNMLSNAIFKPFRRLPNFYFLIVTAICVIPNISPAMPITTAFPHVVLIGFALAHGAYKDFLRKRADAKANYRLDIIRHRVCTTSNPFRYPH